MYIYLPYLMITMDHRCSQTFENIDDQVLQRITIMYMAIYSTRRYLKLKLLKMP